MLFCICPTWISNIYTISIICRKKSRQSCNSLISYFIFIIGSDVVVIPAGVPRKPGMTRDDLFNVNAGIIKDISNSIAKNCPKALVAIITNPVNTCVPIAAEILKKVSMTK